jgi:hypothetical protein
VTNQEETTSDPLIDEVRARRRELMESCGNDLNRLLDRIDELQRQHPDKLSDHRTAASTGIRKHRSK